MDLPDGAAARVVAIASDDSWTHIYPTFDHLLDHNDENEPPLGAVEFFDATGARLATGFDSSWGLVTLTPTADKPDPDRLRARLQAVLRHAADFARDHHEVVKALPNPPENVEKWLRALADDSLDNIIRTIEIQTGGNQTSGFRSLHSGGWAHNLMHAAGWSH